MSEEEILKLIKSRLGVHVEFDGSYVTVHLTLDGEVIATHEAGSYGGQGGPQD